MSAEDLKSVLKACWTHLSLIAAKDEGDKVEKVTWVYNIFYFGA